ncbi:MAG TPA: outer membrane beta-barrel protein, partial [Chthoniobacter sp.]|nr:outer membrane beta-barrel protein [Chthoniobacter sp.]
AWTPKTSLEWDLAAPVSEYSGGIDSSGLTSTTMVNYAYSTKTTFGLGFTTGFTGVAGSDTQTFEQVNARMTSTASPFISYSGTVGFEWRDTGETRSTSPVFGLGATWTPRVGTSLTLTVDQRVQNSAAITGANYTSTSVALSCSQRLGSFASLGASIGYERASYESALSDQTIDRLDQTVFAQASVSRTVFKHISLSATVSYLHTASTDLPQSSTQVSVSASYAF